MLTKFSEWIKMKESSPATRNKLAVAWGTAVPASADVFGHATPPPWQVPKLIKAIGGKKKKRKKRRTKRHRTKRHSS
jgi:hypothetical protein